MSTPFLPLDCDGFSTQLAAYLEGDVSDAVREAMDSHAAACVACGALLADLAAIRRDAAALPVLAPSRDFWAGIAARLDDSVVVPMNAGRRTGPSARWMRPAAAAAALIIATAGVTHLATRAVLARRADQPAGARATTTAAAPAVAPRGVDGELVSTSPAASGPSAASNVVRNAASRPSTDAERRAAPGGSALPLLGSAEPVYNQEIEKLRRIVRERRVALDPATVAVLEQSIAVIDSAIVQSRAALAKDPASGFLAAQLNRSLEKKVELLRTAAMLPAGT